jgi:dienelactone hydrolase
LVVFATLAWSKDLRAAAVIEASLRTNVLVFHGAKGELKPVRSVRDWEKRRKEILAAMQTVMGPLPDSKKRCALDAKIEETRDLGKIVCWKLTYASQPGSRVPAFLLIPKNATNSSHKLPGILALHPTDMEYGNRVVVEQLRSGYRAYGRDLAERGYVVIAPAYPIMADYQPDLNSLGYKSGTMKAIWDNMRALDLLETLPFVDRKHFGAVGHSLGGHNSIYTAVFEPRIKAVVSSCGFDSYRDYKNGNIAGWTSDRYMPALKKYAGHLADLPFDFYEMIAALAPRPVFINAPLRDSNFQWGSVDRIVVEAEKVYGLEGATKIEVVHPDCEHDFPEQVREKAYAFLDRALERRKKK